MKNRIVNLIFPIIMLALLCAAVIAVATAPRMAESGGAGTNERRTGGSAETLPSGPPEMPPDLLPPETGLPETDAPASQPGETESRETEGSSEPPAPETEDVPANGELNGQAVPDGQGIPDGQTVPDEQANTDGQGVPDDQNVADGQAVTDDQNASNDQNATDGQTVTDGQTASDAPEETPPPFNVNPFDGSDTSGSDTDASDPNASDANASDADGSDENTSDTNGSDAEPEPEPEPVSPEPVPAVISASLAAFSPQVQAQIASMSTRELLTQMFIATYDGSWATAGYAAEYDFGGYITFAEDYENDTPQSFREGIDRVTASSKIPPLYAVDEEGGTVTRASKYAGYRRYPFLSPREVYESGGLELIRSDAAEKAELLKTLGLNYNLAPVADISVNTWDYMYNRSPGQDAETTASIVETIVSVFNARGVASAVKHFPGYGAVSDTHTAMAWDGRTAEELESFDLIPFRRAMEAGVPSVMVSHIITALDPERPASVSAKVVDYIRSNMGYDGVLITDDMRMNGILDFCTTGNGSLEAIAAGYDLICCTNWPEQFPVVWAAVENGTLTRERLEISAARILRMKQDLGIWNP